MAGRFADFGGAALVALILLLAGCATPVVTRVADGETIKRYLAEGRFSLRDDERLHSGRISWQHAPERDDILLQDPFGSGLAEVTRRPDGARLQLADGSVREAPDADQLIGSVTGIAVPLVELGALLPGRVVDADDVVRDAAGRASRLDRHGWRIEFSYPDDAAETLPSGVFALRRGVDTALEVRFVIETWELP